MIGACSEGVQDLLEKNFDLFKEPFGIQLAFEDQITGVKTERRIIAEIKAFWPGFFYKSFEHVPGLHHIALALAHAQTLFLEILHLGDDPWGHTFGFQKVNELILFFQRFRGIKVFFHPLKDQETRDLRPFNLREQAFQVQLQNTLRIRSEAANIRHELAVTLLEFLPIRENSPEIIGEDLGGQRLQTGFIALKVAVYERLRTKDFFEGFVVLAVKSCIFNALALDRRIACLHKIEFGTRQFPLLSQEVRQLKVAGFVRKEFQKIRVEIFRSAFDKDRLDGVGLIQVLQEFLDLLLCAVVSVGVLDMKDNP